jgi:hypothetical protein
MVSPFPHPSLLSLLGHERCSRRPCALCPHTSLMLMLPHRSERNLHHCPATPPAYLQCACSSGRLASRDWRHGREGARLGDAPDHQCGGGALGQTCKVPLHARDAHRRGSLRALGALRALASERERRHRPRDLGLGSVSFKPWRNIDVEKSLARAEVACGARTT